MIWRDVGCVRSRTARSRRYGFTTIELLVVIAIAAVLVGLTLAGVQKVRAAAARTTCANHLRQLAVGLHAYASAHGVLPPGVTAERPGERYPFLGWHARLLPYVELQTVWEQTTAAYAADPNFLNVPPHTASPLPVRIFTCPTDPRTVAAFGPRASDRGLTAYLGVEGTRANRPDGVLFLGSAVRLTDVADGTSSTLAVGERPPSADTIMGWWYAGWGQDKDGECDMVLGTRTVNNGRFAAGCPVGPYPFAAGRISNQCDSFHFWSLHPGGGHFAFADGAVRFLRYTADPVLPALGTRAGSESVSSDD